MVLKAVLFDMDGLLTDSEVYGFRVMKAGGRLQGVELPDRLLDEMTGQNDVTCASVLGARYPGLDGAEVMAYYRREMLAASLRGDIPLKPGVTELLDVLDAHRIPRAVVSSNGRAVVEGNLRGILARFDRVISGECTRRSKPEPDIYLAAAEALGVAPDGCLVLEDSPNGLRAGRAAGMRTCMVPDRFPYTEALAPYADDVRASLLDVIPLIGPWLS